MRAILAGLAISITGCANPGIPKPPSLHLPAVVTDLSGARIGNHVELRWTGPDRTTDGLDFKGPATVEICGDAVPVSELPSPVGTMGRTPLPVPCSVLSSESSHAGDFTASIRLGADELTPARRTQVMAYRVRVLNASGRSASPSSAVYLLDGPAPATVSHFRARQKKAGVVLDWDQPTGQLAATMRTDVEVLRELKKPSSGGTPANNAKGTSPKMSPRTSGRVSPVRFAPEERVRFKQSVGEGALSDVMVEQPSVEGQHRDGMIDSVAVSGSTYIYTAQRLKTVSIAGRMFEIRSEPTSPVIVDMRASFPPEPPKGMTGVASTASGSHEVGAGGAAIDLSWEPNSENDIAGYLVYRSALNGSESVTGPVRLTPHPVIGPSYRDEHVLTGRRYVYTVTAIDHRGNESQPSIPFQSEASDR